MRPLVDPTARVDPSARLAPGCVVGAHAEIGPGCVLHPYAVVGPNTVLGAGCQVHPFTVIGGDAQDRRTPPGAPTRLICGPENVFREHVTISRGSEHGGGETRLGAGNLLMAGVHVGHDCVLGNGISLANNTSLAGHVTLGDRVGVGGHAALHQFVRVGELAFVAAHAMVARDVPPYCLAVGDRARLYGLNVTGLRRAGFEAPTRQALRAAFRHLLGPRRSPLPPALRDVACVRALEVFLQAGTRGVCAVLRASHSVDSPLEP